MAAAFKEFVVKRRTHTCYLLFLVIPIDPHKEKSIHRICHTSLTAKAAAHDGSKARAGKRKARDTRGRLKSAKAPSYTQVSSYFGSLENFAEACNGEAAYSSTRSTAILPVK